MLPTNFITQIVEKAYSAFTPSYLVVSKKHFAKLKPYIDRFIEPLHKEKDSLLDVGCGPGLLLEYLRKLGYQNLLGTDISEAELKEAAKRVPSHMLLRQDFHHLSFQPKEFTAATAINSLQYTSKQNLPVVLKKIAHCLDDKAKLFIVLPEGEGELLTEEVYTCPETNQPTQHAVYHSYYKDEEIKSILAETGFNLISLEKLLDPLFGHPLLIITGEKVDSH